MSTIYLRMPRILKQQIEIAAKKNGISVNRFVSNCLDKASQPKTKTIHDLLGYNNKEMG